MHFQAEDLRLPAQSQFLAPSFRIIEASSLITLTGPPEQVPEKYRPIYEQQDQSNRLPRVLFKNNIYSAQDNV